MRRFSDTGHVSVYLGPFYVPTPAGLKKRPDRSRPIAVIPFDGLFLEREEIECANAFNDTRGYERIAKQLLFSDW